MPTPKAWCFPPWQAAHPQTLISALCCHSFLAICTETPLFPLSASLSSEHNTLSETHVGLCLFTAVTTQQLSPCFPFNGTFLLCFALRHPLPLGWPALHTSGVRCETVKFAGVNFRVGFLLVLRHTLLVNHRSNGGGSLRRTMEAQFAGDVYSSFFFPPSKPVIWGGSTSWSLPTQDQSFPGLSELWACRYPYLHLFIFIIVTINSNSSWQLLSSHMGKDLIPLNAVKTQTKMTRAYSLRTSLQQRSCLNAGLHSGWVGVGRATLHRPAHHWSLGSSFCYTETELGTQMTLKFGPCAPHFHQQSNFWAVVSLMTTCSRNLIAQFISHPTPPQAANCSSTWGDWELVSFWQSNSQGVRCQEHKIFMFTSAEFRFQPLLW